MPIQRIPVSVQTLYADLTDRAWSGDLAELMAAGGSPYSLLDAEQDAAGLPLSGTPAAPRTRHPSGRFS